MFFPKTHNSSLIIRKPSDTPRWVTFSRTDTRPVLLKMAKVMNNKKILTNSQIRGDSGDRNLSTMWTPGLDPRKEDKW